MEEKRNSTAIYKEMVSKLITAVHKNDYDTFKEMLDISYTKFEKSEIYSNIANILKDFSYVYKVDSNVTEENGNLILGIYCLYYESSDVTGHHFKKHTAPNALRGIINTGSVWKFSKSKTLNILYKNEYDNILREYNILTSPDCISLDYEHITRKILIPSSFDIKVLTTNINSNDTVTVELAFLNGFVYPINNLTYTITVKDANKNIIGAIPNQYIDILFPRKITTKTYTLTPKTPVDRLDLSWINHSSSYSYRSLL